MPSPIPKDPKTRQRRNKTTTATLVDDAPRKLNPKLPKREDGEPWHAQTLQFWKLVWKSPMAPEYVEADVPGLIRLATLIDAFWKADVGKIVALSAEIRLVGQNYGLSPLDRRRLQWEVKRVEGEKPKRETPKRDSTDPRVSLGELRAVK